MLWTDVDDHLFGTKVALLELVGLRLFEVIAFEAILDLVLCDCAMQGHDLIFYLHLTIFFLFLIVLAKRNPSQSAGMRIRRGSG